MIAELFFEALYEGVRYLFVWKSDRNVYVTGEGETVATYHYTRACPAVTKNRESTLKEQKPLACLCTLCACSRV